MSYDPLTGEWTDNTQTTTDGEDTGRPDPMMLVLGGVVLLSIIGGSLMFMRKGADKEDAFGGMEGAFGADALDPTEQYVQQLIAQGYLRKQRGPLQRSTLVVRHSPLQRQPAAAQPAHNPLLQATTRRGVRVITSSSWRRAMMQRQPRLRSSTQFSTSIATVDLRAGVSPMSEDLERLGRQARIAKWMGIIGIPWPHHGPWFAGGVFLGLP